jgi:hypothetical protein
MTKISGISCITSTFIMIKTIERETAQTNQQIDSLGEENYRLSTKSAILQQ